MLQVNQQQPWSVAVRAKSKNFYFSLKASRFLPLSKIFQVSVRFKLHPFHFKIKSEPHSSFSWKPKSLKRKIFQIFRPKRTKRDGIVGTWCYRKCCVCVSVALVGTVVPHSCKLIWDRDGFSFLWLYFLGLGLKSWWFGGRRSCSFWLIVTVSAMGLLQQLSNLVIWDYFSRSRISFSRCICSLFR